ncbi:NAD(P)-binding protein [Ophiobolus disseminans]|uniref:NAD(P)-binding protein n=1 Tax=Ophiobolus disseminans TaxID=1469910 RepID=A0A6A7A1U8_9PLEO|nr:NAD(P)-binding protein [Ophiobolus disseminans]
MSKSNTNVKSVLITGCSDGGIGSALAISFAQRGLLVFATTRCISSMSKLENLPNVRLLTLDISNATQIREAVEVVKKETGGRLDYLVNNAGLGRFMPLLDEPEELLEAKEIFDINVWAQLNVSQAFAPLLIEAKGTIVYISSLAGQTNVPWIGVYAASKRAAEILFDTLRLELAPFGVKVTSVISSPVTSLGLTHTEKWVMPEDSLYDEIREKYTKTVGGDDGSPRMDTNEYAEVVVKRVLAGGGAKFWAGANAGILKFVLAWMPTFIMVCMTRVT